MVDDLDDAAIERSIAEINEAIQPLGRAQDAESRFHLSVHSDHD